MRQLAELTNELREQLKKQVREAGGINGFFYAHSRLLLDKLAELRRMGKVFRQTSKLPITTTSTEYFTDIAFAVVVGLEDQMKFEVFQGQDIGTLEMVDRLIEIAAKFLAIFEQKTPDSKPFVPSQDYVGADDHES